MITMEKLNIAEMLKDCPKGMELDCTIYENVYFDKVYYDEDCLYKIGCYMLVNGVKTSVYFTEFGAFNNYITAKCVIFPKGKTTLEGFQRPFKDGDVVITKNKGQIFIFKEDIEYNGRYYRGMCYFGVDLEDGKMFKKGFWNFTHLATEEEKHKLFDVIKSNGYKWNAETKTLEDLVVPKFKVGDRVKHKKSYISGVVIEIDDESYKIKYDSNAICFANIKWQDDYDLIPNKFDITTLKPFDKVLVRHSDTDYWKPAFWGKYTTSQCSPFISSYGFTAQAIPFKDNEWLVGTTNECDDYYKTWE